jgi:multiple sugar transport system substrate-binding protein
MLKVALLRTLLLALAVSLVAVVAPYQASVKAQGTVLRMVFPTISTNEQTQADFEKDVIGKFKTANPGVDVKITWVPNFNKLQEVLTTDFAAGTPPDVFILGIGWIPPFAEQLAPLTGSAFGADYLKDFSPSLLETASYKGTLYGIPLVLDTRMLVYRKDIFKAAGLDPEKPPTSWTELREMAIKLTKRDASGKIEIAGFDMPRGGPSLGARSPRQHWFTLLWQWGGDLFSKDLATCTMNTPAAVESLQFYVDMIHKDKVIDVTTDTGVQGQSLLSAGKAAMAYYHNNYWANEASKSKDLAAQIGIIPPFKNPGEGQFYGGWILVSSKASKNAELSAKLLQHITASDSSLWINSRRGGIPARASLQDSDYVKANPLVAESIKRLGIARGEGGPKNWLEMRSLFDPVLEEAINATRTPKSALDEICKQVDKLNK